MIAGNVYYSSSRRLLVYKANLLCCRRSICALKYLLANDKKEKSSVHFISITLCLVLTGLLAYSMNLSISDLVIEILFKGLCK